MLPLLNFGPKGRPWPVDHGARAPAWLRSFDVWRWMESPTGRLMLSFGLVVLSSVVISLLFEVCRRRHTYGENFRFLVTLLIGSWGYFVLGSLFDLETTWHAANIALVTIVVSTSYLMRRPEKTGVPTDA